MNHTIEKSILLIATLVCCQLSYSQDTADDLFDRAGNVIQEESGSENPVIDEARSQDGSLVQKVYLNGKVESFGKHDEVISSNEVFN